MIFQVQSVNGEKTLVPVSGSMSTGNPVGTLITTYKKIRPKNYLYCDGRDTTGTDDELSTHYPALYMYLGSNVLPDYRECVMVGAEQNSTDTIATHDVYTEGQFKDDQMQEHTHDIYVGTSKMGYTGTTATRGQNLGGYAIGGTTIQATNIASGRSGTTTHGKQKAVYVYIKAVDGVDITDEDSFLSVVENYVDTKVAEAIERCAAPHSLILSQTVTTTETTYNTYNSRKISDYRYLIFQIGVTNSIRATDIVVRSTYVAQGTIIVSSPHGSGYSQISAVVFKYNSDTSFKIKTDGAGGLNVVEVFGIL